MGLCGECSRIDYDSLIAYCLAKCIKRQAVGYCSSHEGPVSQHHLDIFEVEKSSQSCDLCLLIFKAFQARDVDDRECARNLPIVFRVGPYNIEVCYDEGPNAKFYRYTKLCGLDIAMHADDVDTIFEEFKIRVDDHPPILNKMENSSDSASFFEISARWLKDCVENHERCTPDAKLQKPPRRLLNVGSGLRDPFLVDTSSNPGPYEWLSLSYCWGAKSCKKLTERRLEAFKIGITMDELESTVRDAILVTRSLQVPYLWVDALCILQDPQATEWKEESSRMNEIYGGSKLTIVVASSRAVSDGFLKDRERQYVSIPILKARSSVEEIVVGSKSKVFLSPEWELKGDSNCEPWSRRGWTMQEGLLPNRLLYFTSSQILWQCCQHRRFERGVVKNPHDSIERELSTEDGSVDFESRWFEDLDTFTQWKVFPEYLPSDHTSDILSQPTTFELWYSLVEDFTRRNFSHISDRLIAISGLAKIYGQKIRCKKYIAGLWGPDLVRGLMWQCANDKLLTGQNPSQQTGGHFPSWSWASIGCERIKFPRSVHSPLAHIEDVDHFSFDHVNKACVTIRGPVKFLPRLYIEGWESTEKQITELERHLSSIISDEYGTDIPPWTYSTQRDAFAIIQMFGGSDLGLLILQDTGKVHDGLQVYRRIGVQVLCYITSHNMASSRLINIRREWESSVAKQLGPRSGKRRTKKSQNKVVIEIRQETWQEQTVMIA